MTNVMDKARKDWWAGVCRQGDPLHMPNLPFEAFREGWEARERFAAESDAVRLARMVAKYFGDGPINPLLDGDIALREAARALIAKESGA
jgi:hypothetical protein